MPAERLMPTDESVDLIELTRDIVAKELRPKIADLDARAEFPARSSAPSDAPGC